MRAAGERERAGRAHAAAARGRTQRRRRPRRARLARACVAAHAQPVRLQFFICINVVIYLS